MGASYRAVVDDGAESAIHRLFVKTEPHWVAAHRGSTATAAVPATVVLNALCVGRDVDDGYGRASLVAKLYPNSVHPTIVHLRHERR